MKKIVVMLALLLAAVSSYAELGTNVYVSVNFESDIVGTNPVCSYTIPDGNSTNSFATASAHAWVVASSPISSGKALEYVDNDTNGVQVAYNALPVTNGMLSSLRFDFTFSPLRTDSTSANQLWAGVAITNGSIGSSANRFCATVLGGDGTIQFRGNGAYIGAAQHVTSGSVHKVSAFVNDTANLITYTDP